MTIAIGFLDLVAGPARSQTLNVPDAQQTAVIDRETKSVVATWRMKQFRANSPTAPDEANHRLFIGRRQPTPHR